MGSAPGPAAQAPRARRRRRLTIMAAGLLVAAAACGLITWAIVNPGAYGQSRDGCVTVSVPSSTGGALEHGCGGTARAMCRAAFANHDKLALATRQQCRLAGISGPP